jgi:5-methylthioadenosine/S-adenosylhomocysteine deaminase
MSFRRAVSVLWMSTSLMVVGLQLPDRALGQAAQQPFDPARGIVLHGVVVTMDPAGTILQNGNVLVRSGKIIAVWRGAKPPAGTAIDDAVDLDFGPRTVIVPGLINLHNHPSFDMVHLWPAPSSHVQADRGRPLGTEPYANRYQWNQVGVTSPPEYRRLVGTPADLLTSSIGLGLLPEVVKYAEVKAILGGETAFQGASQNSASDNILIRNVDNLNFGQDRVDTRVNSIGAMTSAERDALLGRMRAGLVDAWLIHLAEGVRDDQRRPGDTFSSRAEFATLQGLGLLSDMTVIIHGTGLEADDFASMRNAPSLRTDGSSDGLGAKLVWSPLSNLLLYGQTALVYQALRAGVTVCLGTDWSPSGSRNLLGELKIADIALRDDRLLGGDRDLVPELSVTGKSDVEARAAEVALDRRIVEMVTTNPAKALRWIDKVGSIERGKFADLMVFTAPDQPASETVPDSPYRSLIDATERDVRLVLVNGEPLAGDVPIMATLKPGDYESMESATGGFRKAVDVTNPAVSRGTETLHFIEETLADALRAMGGDNPPPGGGPADDSNTYTYLKARIPGASSLTDAEFRQRLTFFFGLTPDGRLNMEKIELTPVLVEDDDFHFHLLEADADQDGLIADGTPPFKLYPANFNHVQALGNPFDASGYRDRYYLGVSMGMPTATSPFSPSPTSSPTSRSSAVSPNPSNPAGTLTFSTSRRGRVIVRVFGPRGQLVRRLLDEEGVGPGEHRLRMDGRDDLGRPLGSGVYYYRIEEPAGAQQGRFLILR